MMRGGFKHSYVGRWVYVHAYIPEGALRCTGRYSKCLARIRCEFARYACIALSLALPRARTDAALAAIRCMDQAARLIVCA